MKIPLHSAREFAAAVAALLPPGAAWQWPAGGLGDNMLLGTAQELARIEAHAQQLLDHAIATHRPKESSWHLSAYQRVADEALGTLQGTPGQPLVTVKHLPRPLRVGSRVGDALWSTSSRYSILIYYDGSAINAAHLQALQAALATFAQAHVVLWFIDITGI